MGFVIGIIVLGLVFVVGIVSLSHRFEMKKMEMSAKLEHLSTDTEKRVDNLVAENQNLRRRIENLEEILVDKEMKLMTGIEGNYVKHKKAPEDDTPFGREIDL